MSGSFRDQPSRFSRRNFLIGSGVAAAGLAFYSGEIARHNLETVNIPLRITNLPDSFRDYRIAQISDIHLDEFTEPFFLEHIVHTINGLAPDLVLITGDFVTRGSLNFIVDGHPIHRSAEILSALTCPLRYGVLGNHDVAVSSPLVVEALTTRGIPVLVNQYVPIERKSDRLWLCGADDPATSHPDLNLSIPAKPDGPVILMAHEPDYVETVLQHPRGALVDLMLAGHTHGGQIRLPLAGALVLPPMGQKFVEGYFRLDHLQLYVNRGVGTVGLPFRFNCPPELTIFILQPA